MTVTFSVISDKDTLYKGELRESVEGMGPEAVTVFYLTIPRQEDIKKVFESLHIDQMVTIIMEGRQIDFYKTISNASDHLLSTKQWFC